MREESVVLKHRIDATAVRWQNIEPFAFHQDLAQIAALEPRNYAQQCRLARAAFSENGQELAFRNLQRNVAKHGILTERLGDISDGKQGFQTGLLRANDGFGTGSHAR